MRRLDPRQYRFHAEERYARYAKEVRNLLADADHDANNGRWKEASDKYQAAMQTLAAAAGTCQELSLLYMMTEE